MPTPRGRMAAEGYGLGTEYTVVTVFRGKKSPMQCAPSHQWRRGGVRSSVGFVRMQERRDHLWKCCILEGIAQFDIQ